MTYQGRIRTMAITLAIAVALPLLPGCPPPPVAATENIAREWNELMLAAMRKDKARPPVYARTLFHVSAAMYEAWAAYDDTATCYFTGYRLKQPAAARTLANRAEAISFAAYTVLKQKFSALAVLDPASEGFAAYAAFTSKMKSLGYLDALGNPVPSDAQALGTRIGQLVISYGAGDGSNEANNFANDIGYAPFNPTLTVDALGTNNVTDPNRWQPLVVGAASPQGFLAPQWGRVKSFSLNAFVPFTTHLPVEVSIPKLGTATDQDYIDQFTEVLTYSAALDPETGLGAETIALSPGVRGNNALASNDGGGHPLNPYTGLPYAENDALAGDYYRAQAEYWADGPNSETPPGHWNLIANDIITGTDIVTQRPANKPRAADLEYDVKLYFALNAALHDAAIATWDIKRFYDYTRPITAIRYMAEQGILELVPGFVEVIQEGDPLAGIENENVGAIKAMMWLGPDQGVGWGLAEQWTPYQAANFVTPPFPGLTSGHSCFSRAAAGILTRFTGDAYFPGGLAETTRATLSFEAGPSAPVTLQWATYYDASDEAGTSRLSGGIHHQADDFGGRILGDRIAERVWSKAKDYFEGRGVAVAKAI